MVSQQQPSTASPPPLKKSKSPPLSPTTIHALDKDILREIFLRLPSLPSLVRAALTCHTFLDAVRSSPAFRRRFRALHPPPLLGLFIDIYIQAAPVFAPLRRRADPDLAAVVGGADFFLTLLPDEGKDTPHWEITGCRDGYVVLDNFETEKVAAYNPLTRALILVPYPPNEVGNDMCLEFHFLFTEQDHGSSRVLCISRGVRRACTAVFSSETRDWQVFPWAEDDEDEQEFPYHDGRLVTGFVYWTFRSRGYARVLNTATLQFSRIDLPPDMEGQETLRAGETKDGELCMACITELSLVVWVWRADDYGVKRWILDKTFPLEVIARAAGCSLEDHDAPKLVGIIDGSVYMSSYQDMRPSSGCFISFCLETSRLDDLCPAVHDSNVCYPYIMAWPPSLLRNERTSLSS